jgi:cytochrome c551/c552
MHRKAKWFGAQGAWMHRCAARRKKVGGTMKKVAEKFVKRNGKVVSLQQNKKNYANKH